MIFNISCFIITFHCLDMKVTEIAKIIGSEWNNLNQDQKSVNNTIQYQHNTINCNII